MFNTESKEDRIGLNSTAKLTQTQEKTDCLENLSGYATKVHLCGQHPCEPEEHSSHKILDTISKNLTVECDE